MRHDHLTHYAVMKLLDNFYGKSSGGVNFIWYGEDRRSRGLTGLDVSKSRTYVSMLQIYKSVSVSLKNDH